MTSRIPAGRPATSGHDLVPDGGPRLLTDRGAREGLAAYRAGGGYRTPPDSGELLELVEASGLRGRGGASFPTARKMRAVRAGDGPPVVVANGEEGEPTSVKDRWLLRHRPHLVLDGARYAAAAVGADLVHVYLADPDAERSVAAALDEVGPLGVDVRVVRVAPTYVAGEETAAVQAINGGPALPTDKPPRPYESGVGGRPTLVSNVETLANLPVLARLGATAFRSAGTDRAPGTFLLTLGGSSSVPGLHELPLGVPLGVALAALGDTEQPTGFLMGGYFGGLIGPQALEVPLDYDALVAAGSGLGCGAVTVLGPDDCPVDTAERVMAYFALENAGQCGSCFNGTAAMSAVLSALVGGFAEDGDIERLRRWSVGLRRRGACGTLDGAAQLAASLLREFPDAIRTHLAGACRHCRPAGRAPRPAPVAALLPTPLPRSSS